MPRENTCLLCGVRSSCCLVFPTRRMAQRDCWLRALAMTDDELKPRGGNYVCRNHFSEEDFDQDGNLCAHAIPQPMSPSSSLVGETYADYEEELLDTRMQEACSTEAYVKQETVENDAFASSSQSYPVAQAGASGLSSTISPASVKQEPLTRIKQEVPEVQVKQEIKQEPNVEALECLEQLDSSSFAGNHQYARPAQRMPADSSGQSNLPGTASSNPVTGAVAGSSTSSTTAGQAVPAAQDGIITSSSDHDCPVCLQPFSHPVKLPCSHIFCFLCAKGFASQHGRCAFCRAPIPAGYMDLPVLVPEDHHYRPNANVDSKFVWYYEGRNGWWQFEERHSDELEEALQNGASEHELQIAGFIYVIDMQRMVQFRKDRMTRTRRIKRDLFTAPRKGIAGLREDLISGSMI